MSSEEPCGRDRRASKSEYKQPVLFKVFSPITLRISEPVAETTGCNNYKILIAEDIPMNRTLVGDILTYHGYGVIEAKNREEAVRIVREQEPDLIIMDL